MQKAKMKTYGVWLILAAAAFLLKWILAGSVVAVFERTVSLPLLWPSTAVWAAMWAMFSLLIGAGSARICLRCAGRARNLALGMVIAHLTVDLLWCLVFFQLQSFGASVALLGAAWALAAAMIIAFQRVDSGAAWLQMPYLFWLSFVMYLNLGAWLLN